MTSPFLFPLFFFGVSGCGDVVGTTTVVAVVAKIMRGGEKVVGREGMFFYSMLCQCISSVILPWLLLVLSSSN